MGVVVAGRRVAHREAGIAVLAGRALVDDRSVHDERRVEGRAPRPADAVDGPDPAVLREVGRVGRMPVGGVGDEPRRRPGRRRDAALTAGTTAAAPRTASEPAGSAKSFWTSTTTRAVDRSRGRTGRGYRTGERRPGRPFIGTRPATSAQRSRHRRGRRGWATLPPCPSRLPISPPSRRPRRSGSRPAPPPTQPVHRTIIWVVTDGPDAFIRSVRGTSARWYREVIAHPELTVRAGGTVLQARAVPATDPDSIARVNAGLVAKYTGIDGFEPMLVPDIFDATLRLEPA